jgi:hypothetical protein
MKLDCLKFLIVAFACGLISASASAGSKPGPEIGTILVAEQAAGSPTMAPPMTKMKDKMVRKGERLITGPFGRRV